MVLAEYNLSAQTNLDLENALHYATDDTDDAHKYNRWDVTVSMWE